MFIGYLIFFMFLNDIIDYVCSRCVLLGNKHSFNFFVTGLFTSVVDSYEKTAIHVTVGKIMDFLSPECNVDICLTQPYQWLGTSCAWLIEVCYIHSNCLLYHVTWKLNCEMYRIRQSALKQSIPIEKNTVEYVQMYYHTRRHYII